MEALTRSMAYLALRRPATTVCHRCRLQTASRLAPSTLAAPRLFSTTAATQSWLLPKKGHNKKDRKGRPRVPTGGSMRGTTVVWGAYGLRLLDHHRRISAAQLRNGEEAIKKRLRGMRYRLYTRVAANIGVFTKGNESRMGKGKGSFDYWASRVAVSKVVFELEGDIHEQIVKDAFRLAGNKMPGSWEFVKKGDPPVMGISKVVNPIVEQSLRSPRKDLPVGSPSLDGTAGRLASNTNPLPPITPDVHPAPSTVGLSGLA